GRNYFQNTIIVKVGDAVNINTPATADDNVYVFPNPAKDVFNIVLDDVNVSEIHIVDVAGREVQKLNAANKTFVSIPVSSYAPGIYLMEMKAGHELIKK